MKYLVLSPGYPSKDDMYNNAFVHSRVKVYKEKNLNFDVFSVTKSGKDYQEKYTFDGIEVCTGNYEALANFLNNNKYDKILVHFAFRKTIKVIQKYASNTPLIIWVHGVEALGWYRRLFLFDIKKFYRFFGYILVNTRQMIFMHNFLKNQKINKEFIFVSEWMKDILERDSLSKGKIKNYHIIPNVIDEKVFKYTAKKETDRLNILSIRPFASKKYANDLSVKAILELQKMEFFPQLKFSIYGDGKLFDKTINPLKNISNVSINKKFLSQKEIAELHKINGIILIPTRQDAQGVSMCEGMMSGLVPVTSNNTAIPEYVPEYAGYLTNNYKELALAIKDMYDNPKKFLQKSAKAHKFMKEKCSSDIVIKKELEIITK